MSSIHQIRLRGPWDFCFANEMQEYPQAELKFARTKFPATWRQAFGERPDDVTLVRSFSSPDGLEAGNVVWLSLCLSSDALVLLNSFWLGILAGGTIRIDITALLQPRNKVSVTLDAPDEDQRDEICLEAALLIESVD